MKIGVFDSGLGGLHVLKAVRTHLPHYDYEYYGDTAHVPYGDRSESDIFNLTKAGVAHLFANDCLIIILACNTASAETLRRLQDEWLPVHYPDRRILGVIIPVVETVVTNVTGRALLLATRRTVSSGKYHFELGKLDKQRIKIEAEATPELAPLIEADKISAAVQVAAERITQRKGGDYWSYFGLYALYCFESWVTRAVSGPGVFSQDEIIPLKLEWYLTRHPELDDRLTTSGTQQIFFSKQGDKQS